MEEKTIIKHYLIPEYVKINEDERKALLDKYNISIKQLPMIKLTDPSVKTLALQVGDILKVKRKSPTAKETEYYRVVVND
jgi:DNA-directed RNA polymerase subunit H